MEYWICFGDSALGTLDMARRSMGKKETRVVALLDDLSVGPIADLTDRDARAAGVCPWRADPSFAADAEECIDRYWQEVLPVFEGIGAGDQAVVWYSGIPLEVCGMLRAVHDLRARGAETVLVNVGGRHKTADLPALRRTRVGSASAVVVLTKNKALNAVLTRVPQWLLARLYDHNRKKSRKNMGEEFEFRGVGDIHPEYVPYFYGKRRALPDCEAEKLAARWEALAAENAPLRVMENGWPVSAAEDAYDAVILECVPEEAEKAALAVGSALHKLPIGDWQVFERIRALAAKGAVEIVQDGDNYRDTVIRRAKEG